MKKIKWGVIGTAGIARSCTIPGMIQAYNCELYAIAGRSIDKAEQFKEKFGFEKAYGSYKELLDDPEVEAVYIALPNTLHYEWAVKAMKSGKHVLCEKPLAPCEKQVKELFETAKENHVYLMEAFAYQHSPYITAIKKEIEDGTIGEVCYIDSAFITSDYNKENIRMRRETLGGCTYDLGVYNTSLTLGLLNEEPEKVEASAIFSEEKIDKLTSVVMEFADGKKAAFLIQNMFPITLKYIDHVHTKNGNPVPVNKKLQDIIRKNTKSFIAISEKGIKVTFTDIIKLRDKLV